MVDRRNAIGRARIKGKAKKFLKRDGQTDERVHHAIYAAIISHQISPGTALQEDALAGAFGVSRTIIRKVLQRLSHERLVDLVPNKGASVAQPSAGEAREVFEARRVLERIFVGQVVERASDADLNNLLKLAKTEEQAFERGDRQARVQLSGDFHRHLSVLAGNKVLSDFLNELISRTSLIIALFESPGTVPCSHSEHREIADALRRRDSKKAMEFMDHHLRHVEAQIELSESHVRADFRSLFSKIA